MKTRVCLKYFVNDCRWKTWKTAYAESNESRKSNATESKDGESEEINVTKTIDVKIKLR